MSAVYSTPLEQALASPRYEIVPMRSALKQARELPANAVVSVTCSPTRGVDATVALAERISAMGYTAVPHLAARRFTGQSHLHAIVTRLQQTGINDVFVVGGDDPADAAHGSSAFACGRDVLAALVASRFEARSIGIPCYPEGHAYIGDALLDQALDEKSPFADYMVTQICFDPTTIRQWLTRIRARGITLPVYIGIPGVIERRKLLGIALRIGLGDSTRFLKKGASMLGQLVGTPIYRPDVLVDGLADLLAEPELGVAGFHINSFNQVEKTEDWRKQRLAAAAAVESEQEQAAYNTL